MAKTVVGLMESSAEAERVVRDLTNTCRCDRADIGLMARGPEETSAGATADDRSERNSEMAHGAMKGAGTGAALGGVLGLVAGVASLSIPGFGPFIAAGPIAAALAGAGVGAAAGGIIGALANLGVPEDEAHYYAEGVRRGGTLVTVHARSDEIADCAANVMRQHGAVDIDERSQQWRREGWSGRLGSESPRGEDVMPVVQEELVVGKRAVNQAGVRVYSNIVETPVEKTVHLRDEHVNVERRPVDRPVQPGDDAFRERTIEVRESAEEPVVSKRARVVEEVHVNKDVTERDATIRDTVRKTDVKVEQPGTARAASARSGHRYTGSERRRSNAPAYSGVERRAMH
jgi:uncharacterized protein (TIGR02271 family)